MMRDPLMARPAEHGSGEPLLKPAMDGDTDSQLGVQPYQAAKNGTGAGFSRLVDHRGAKACKKRGGGTISGDENPRGRIDRKNMPGRSRRHEMRSCSPPVVGQMSKKHAAHQKLFLSALALALCLVTFVIATEGMVTVQQNLGWDKPYCMLYLNHSAWTFLWPLTILYLRLQKRDVPWKSFIRSHLSHVRTTAQMARYQSTRLSHYQANQDPLYYMFKMFFLITLLLTVAAISWYIAVNMTTASDLTAIYNCSAFFAYAFSIPILNEKVRKLKVFSVVCAIIGVLIVAYGGGDGTSEGGSEGGSRNKRPISTQVLGNIIIGIGSVIYGLYEVLYKKLACPPQDASPGRCAIFASVVATAMGTISMVVFWIPIPILHYLGLETFELPTGEAAWVLFMAISANFIFTGCFLALMSLTSPVLSSVAALLTIFLVAIVDYLLTGAPLTSASIVGGLVIIIAFLMLAWDTWKEMTEETGEGKEEDLDEEACEACEEEGSGESYEVDIEGAGENAIKLSDSDDEEEIGKKTKREEEREAQSRLL